MASQNRGPAPAVSADPGEELRRALLAEGSAFSFFQVLRLLRCLWPGDKRREPAPGAAGPERALRVAPNLSLSFPPAEVERIELKPDPEGGGDRIEVVANFLGLYGSASPLPTFYTEELIAEEAADESVAREVFNLVNSRLYALLFRCWSKYRLPLRVLEEEDRDTIARLFCLAGLGEGPLWENLPAPFRLLRYIGLLTQFPRSALGLRTLLGDALEGVPVGLTPCVPRMAAIPRDQQLCMGRSGCRLGVDSYIGERIADRMGKFRIHLGPVSNADFHRLVPGRANYAWLTLLTGIYVTEPLEYEVEVIMAAGEAKSVRLGDPSCAVLGVDSWIFSGPSWGEVSVAFDASRARRRPSRGSNA
jgi:type VI secretion system protein ImpH